MDRKVSILQARAKGSIQCGPWRMKRKGPLGGDWVITDSRRRNCPSLKRVKTEKKKKERMCMKGQDGTLGREGIHGRNPGIKGKRGKKGAV